MQRPTIDSEEDEDDTEPLCARESTRQSDGMQNLTDTKQTKCFLFIISLCFVVFIYSYKEKGPISEIQLVLDDINNINESNDANNLNITKVKSHRQPDGKLRLLVTKGCSGSSFVVRTLKEIIEAHGFTLTHGHSEVYKPGKNQMFEEAKRVMPEGTSERNLVIAATVMLNQQAHEKGRLAFFKWPNSMLPDIVEKVGRENVLVGSMIRQNILDGLICSVRDCFPNGKKFGYPVFVNGSRTKLCFNRRKVQSVKTMAYFPPKKLTKMAAFLRRSIDNNEMVTKTLDTQTYEELTSLQYTNDVHAVNASMRAWGHLVSNLIGDHFERDIVYNEMYPMVNSRREHFHEDYVYNYDDLFRVLRNLGLGDLIRSRSRGG